MGCLFEPPPVHRLILLQNNGHLEDLQCFCGGGEGKDASVQVFQGSSELLSPVN